MAHGDNDNTKSDGELSRSISPNMLAIYGLGTILGAGIYVVIGKIIGEAGALAPLAFAVAAAAAAFTALSYAELGTRIPESGGSAAFVAKGFDRRWLTIITGWALVATGLVSAATIATGFDGYLGVFVNLSKWWTIPLLVGTLTLVAVIGVKESAWFMGITTAAGVAGLFYVLWFALPDMANYPSQFMNALSAGNGGGTGLATGVLLGSFLAFYAFIGFEDIVTLSEEARDQTTALPRAIFFALIVALVFYILVAIAAVSVMEVGALDNSQAPLVDVVEAKGRSGTLVGALSLLIIVNGALAQIVMAARVVHDLGKRRNGALDWLSSVSDRTGTPVIATILGGATVTALALFFPTETLAGWTSFIILGVFFAANAALVKLKRDGVAAGDGVRTYPIAIPICGMIACAVLIVGQFTLGGGGH